MKFSNIDENIFANAQRISLFLLLILLYSSNSSKVKLSHFSILAFSSKFKLSFIFLRFCSIESLSPIFPYNSYILQS